MMGGAIEPDGTAVIIADSHGHAAYRGRIGRIEGYVPFGKYHVRLSADGARILVDESDLRKLPPSEQRHARRGWYVETRLPPGDPSFGGGLPWTREGCQDWRDGKHVPYHTREAADRAIRRLREQDDPTWQRALFRVVAAR